MLPLLFSSVLSEHAILKEKKMIYIIVLLLIGLVILAHETGHFFAARMAKMPVAIFSIGFGPALWRLKRGETEYRLSLIPLGGYVLPAVENEDEFFSIDPDKRIAMTLGGPLASVILPFLIFAVVNSISSGLSFNSILFKPAVQVSTVLYKMLISLPLLFAKGNQLSGIVGIVVQGGSFIGGNAIKAANFTALLSLNLALLNILPFPVLDGGKIVLYLLEKIHKSFVRLHLPLAMAGWLILAGLMIYVTIIDIGKLIS